ncbi:MAG: family 10 glycosylhydrolase [Candidatus Kryptoniota bacterium]
MKRREFAKILGVAGIGLVSRNVIPTVNTFFGGDGKKKRKQWIWIGTDVGPSADEWKKRFSLMRQSGVDAVLPEIYNSHQAFYESKHLPTAGPWLEKILPLAKAEGLEVHAWMWSMPCNIPEVAKQHPEWFVVNRNGDSASEKPAYVNWYKFLCPSRPEVQEFVKQTVSELSSIDGLDGIHLDYIRYPDVILPEGLQPKYGIKQDHEYPEYDYCYCDVCRHDFEKETGDDPIKLSDPAANGSWRQFRYDRVTHLVNDILIPAAHANNKRITAAVFPNWENVRQQWPVWKLDAVMPMLYAAFYDGGIDWIEAQTDKGVKSLHGRMPLYSGLMVFQLNPDDLSKAIDACYQSGASGVSLFSAQSMTPEKWASLSKAVTASG